MKYDKLPKLFKKRWLKALLSGDYKQGNGLLYDREAKTYCCLGVAADILGCRTKPDGTYLMKGEVSKNGLKKVPQVLLGDEKLPLKLAEMNDKPKSFKAIAKWIDKNL